jgi:hypothetical protein
MKDGRAVSGPVRGVLSIGAVDADEMGCPALSRRNIGAAFELLLARP